MELWHTINLKMTEMKFNLTKKKINCYKKYKSQEVEDPKKFIFFTPQNVSLKISYS